MTNVTPTSYEVELDGYSITVYRDTYDRESRGYIFALPLPDTIGGPQMRDHGPYAKIPPRVILKTADAAISYAEETLKVINAHRDAVEALERELAAKLEAILPPSAIRS